MLRSGVTLVVGCLAGPAFAAVQVADLGTSAPPAAIAGFTMTAFPLDGRPVQSTVNSVASPLGGNVGFSSNVSLRQIGNGWATWSHGYTGSVYTPMPNASSVTLALPANTAAFYFYAEPDSLSVFSMTVTGTDGGTPATLTLNVSGSAGANGFGFLNSTGSITSISISTTDSSFAVGEFGIAVPAPGSGGALLGALGIRRNRR